LVKQFVEQLARREIAGVLGRKPVRAREHVELSAFSVVHEEVGE
jgi:hypothetical protein